MADRKKASTLIAKLMYFMRDADHPKGYYSQNDMIYAVKLWAQIGMNVPQNNPKDNGAGYWTRLKKYDLRDYSVSGEMPIPQQSPDDDPNVTPVQAFRAALLELDNQLSGSNDVALGYAFNNAEGTFGIMLTAYRIMLARSAPAAGTDFRHSLSRLSHQTAP